MFDTLLKRVDERMQLVDQLLAESAKYDFDEDELIITDPDKTIYATNAEEMRQKWVKRIKYDSAHPAIRRKDTREGDSRQVDPPLPQLRQADAPDQQRRTAGNVSHGDDFELRSAHLLHVGRHARKFQHSHEGRIGRHRRLAAIRRWQHRHQRTRSTAAPLNATAVSSRKIASSASAKGKGGEIVDVVDMSLNDTVKLIRGKQRHARPPQGAHRRRKWSRRFTTSPAPRSS